MRSEKGQSPVPVSVRGQSPVPVSVQGQSLIEVIIASAAGILIVAALVFTTLFSLRNANFAKTSAQATKLAQEGIEKVRTIRNRDVLGSVYFTACPPEPESCSPSNGGDVPTASKFSDLWVIKMRDSCDPCYFILNNNVLNQSVPTGFDDLGNGLKRQVQISDDANYDIQKTITVIVQWSDATGPHESKLVTILRKL